MKFLSSIEPRKIPNKELIFCENEEVDEMLFIVEGTVSYLS
jgi:hypothetical protein